MQKFGCPLNYKILRYSIKVSQHKTQLKQKDLSCHLKDLTLVMRHSSEGRLLHEAVLKLRSKNCDNDLLSPSRNKVTLNLSK